VVAHGVEGARSIGLRRADAEAFAADWHGVSRDTIRDSYRRVCRVERDRPAVYFLSRSCKRFLETRFTNPAYYCPTCGERRVWKKNRGTPGGVWGLPCNHPDDPAMEPVTHSRRWLALLEKYRDRRRTPDFRDKDHQRL